MEKAGWLGTQETFDKLKAAEEKDGDEAFVGLLLQLGEFLQPIYFFDCLVICSIDCLAGWLLVSFCVCLLDWLVASCWLVGWLVVSFCVWLFGWLVVSCWLVGWLVASCWLFGCLVASVFADMTVRNCST